MRTSSVKLAIGFLTAQKKEFNFSQCLVLLIFPFLLIRIQASSPSCYGPQQPLSGNSRGNQALYVERRRNHTTRTYVQVHKAAKAEQVLLNWTLTTTYLREGLVAVLPRCVAAAPFFCLWRGSVAERGCSSEWRRGRSLGLFCRRKRKLTQFRWQLDEIIRQNAKSELQYI